MSGSACLNADPGSPRIERASPDGLAVASQFEVRLFGANLDPRPVRYDADRARAKVEPAALECTLLAPGGRELGVAECTLETPEQVRLGVDLAVPPPAGIYGARLAVEGNLWAEERFLFELR